MGLATKRWGKAPTKKELAKAKQSQIRHDLKYYGIDEVEETDKKSINVKELLDEYSKYRKFSNMRKTNSNEKWEDEVLLGWIVHYYNIVIKDK